MVNPVNIESLILAGLRCQKAGRDEAVLHDWCCIGASGLQAEAAKGVWVQGLGVSA